MPFTTLQFLHRLTRKLKVRDHARLGAADRLELLDAANTGLSALTDRLPPTRRETAASESLRAPVTLALSIVNGAKAFTYTLGSPWPVGGYGEEANLLGHSVYIPGDSRLNRLNRPGELLSPYLGSTGTPSATFYGDAVQLGQTSRRIIGPPLWTDGAESRTLHHLAPPYPLDEVQTGSPRYYWTEPLLGHERVTTPLWLLRVWPLPPSLGTLTYRIENIPAALTLEDFTTPRALPIEDTEIGHLTAWSEQALIGSMLLQENTDKNAIYAAVARAETAFDLKPQTQHTEHGEIAVHSNW